MKELSLASTYTVKVRSRVWHAVNNFMTCHMNKITSSSFSLLKPIPIFIMFKDRVSVPIKTLQKLYRDIRTPFEVWS